MTKKELREIYKAKRKQIADPSNESKKILEFLKSNFDFEDKVVSVFVPIEHLLEINTWSLFEPVGNNDTFFCVPRVDWEKKEMHHFLYEGKEQLSSNKWGILEPKSGSPYSAKEFDFVIVPLLAYDQKGNRIGYGGGFYDRFLSQCRKDVVKIGLSFFEPEENEFETEETDIRLDFCLTPLKIHEFK